MTIETPVGGSRNRLTALLPILLTALVYLGTTTNRGVIDYDEGYYSQVALHMLKRGDWVTPYANGVRFLDKPPLMYWLSAASLRLFGVNESALRLPSALGVLALVWVVALIARRGSGERAATIAALCTAFSVGTYLFTREALHDIWLVLFVTLAMYAFLDWHLDPRHSLRRALLFYAALAGAVMCKSLVGLAFPIGIVALYFLISRERPGWRDLHVLPGTLLFLLIAAPWHIMAASRNRAFLWDFFVNEQFLRFVGKHDPPVLWSVPLLSFWLLLLVWFFPWTAFLPAAFLSIRNTVDRKEKVLIRLVSAWLFVILGFFSLLARLEHYAFPVLPALGLLVGVVLSREEEGRAVTWGFRGLAIAGALALACGVGAGVWIVTSGHRFEDASAAPTSVISETDFSILAEMPAAVRRNLLAPAALTVGVLVLGFGAALRLRSHRRPIPAIISLAVVMMVVCGMIHWSLMICEDLISSKKFALAIAEQARPGDRLVVVGDYESANSLGFYQPLQVEVLEGAAYHLIPGMKYPDSPKVVLTPQDFERTWQSGCRVFALVPKARLTALNLGGTKVLEVLHRALVRNH